MDVWDAVFPILVLLRFGSFETFPAAKLSDQLGFTFHWALCRLILHGSLRYSRLLFSVLPVDVSV